MAVFLPRFSCWPFRSAARVAGLLAFACGWGLPTLRAELTWTQKTIELQADAKADVLEAHFRFTNAGAKPIDIRQVQTSCGCTTVALEQRHYEPGQAGEIIARFDVGGRVGLQKKTIAVFCRDALMPTTLSLVVHIPELVRIQPAFLTWQQGEPGEVRIIRVESAQSAVPLEDVKVQSSNPALAATLQPDGGPGKYQISVRPATTDRPLFTTLMIQCRVGSQTKNFRAFASVRAPSPAPAKSPAVQPAAPPPATDDSLVPPG